MLKFETVSVDEALLEMTKGMPYLGTVDTPLWYDPAFGAIKGNQKGFNPRIASAEIAMLTIKQNGSAPRGYRSISEAPAFQVSLHIGGKLPNDDLLVSDIAEEGKLIRPAKLSLQHIIAYETLKNFR